LHFVHDTRGSPSCRAAATISFGAIRHDSPVAGFETPSPFTATITVKNQS